MSRGKDKPDKKSFLLYCDQANIIEKLTDEQAGFLIKQVYSYCNDGRVRPEIEDPLVDIVFTALQTSLDRDYEKYLKIVQRNRNNGALGGRPSNKPKKPTGLSGNPKNPKNPSEPDNDSGNDNDSDSDSETDTKKKISKVPTKTDLKEKILEHNLIENKDKIFEFFEYRMSMPTSKRYKTKKGLNALFRDLVGCRDRGLIISDCIDEAMEREWQTPKPDYFENHKTTGGFNGGGRSNQNTQACIDFINEGN